MQSLNAVHGNLVAMPSSLRELRSFPAAWKHAMAQCCTVILLFAFVAAVSQRAALGVVVLGMVRAFALLAIIAGGVPWATAVLSSRQHMRAAAEAPILTASCEAQAALQKCSPALTRAPVSAEVLDAPSSDEVEREAQEGSVDDASAMLQRMLDGGGQPSAAAFHAVVRAYAAEAQPAQASAWLERMLAEGKRPEAAVFNAAMSAHMSASDAAGARALLDRMAELQWKSLLWVQGHWATQLEEYC